MARDYDPAVGRYVESDPIGLKGGLNTYGYAYQSPVSYFDPDGQVVIDFHALGCALLQIHVRIVCKELKRRCEASDSCEELNRKTNLHLTCAIAQSSLTNFCFPDNPTHQQRITDALQGARRCLGFYTTKCSSCAAPPPAESPFPSL